MSKALKQYTNTYGYNDLIKKYNFNDYGIWKVSGEDPNCDFGGCHSNPHIAYVEGHLEEVLHWAVEQPRFWTLGAGGKIEKIEVENILSLVDKGKLIRNKYKRELKNVLSKIDNMTDSELLKILEEVDDTIGRAIRGE